MGDRYQQAVDRFAANLMALTRRMALARTQVDSVLSTAKAQLLAQAPSSLTAGEVEMVLQGFETTVASRVQRLIGSLQLPLRWAEESLPQWGRRRESARSQIRLRREQLQRLETEPWAQDPSSDIVRERLQQAKERLRNVEEELQRIEYAISEVERLIAGYRREFAAFEIEVQEAIDRAAAFIRQRGPIARA